MTSLKSGFLDERRLLRGPWQAFERDVARLLIAYGYDDVRIVAGSGDHGGDILAVLNGELWVVQCKLTTTQGPPKEAINEVVAAGQYYGSQHLMVAVSRSPTDAFLDEQRRYRRQGLGVSIATPAWLLDRMSDAPEYAHSRLKPRGYQEDACHRFREALLDTKRAQIVMATGLGKTVVMAELVADLLRDGLVKEGRVLVVAHTRAIVDQLHRAFWRQLPKWVHTHQLTQGEYPTYWDGICFATIQSVRIHIEDLPKFGLVLIDEAHHIGAATFQDTIQGLAPDLVGGVTATPWRGDGFDIDQLLGPAIVKLGIEDGIRNGFLTDVDYRLLADNLDWEFIQARSTHGYSLSQLNRRLIIPTRDEEAAKIVREVFDRTQRQRGVVFSPTIEHAYEFAAVLRRWSFRAEAIASDRPAREREVLLARFRAGNLDFVCSVDLFNEGVDLPDVDLIVFLRATHSRRIFVQQLGRGLRLSPGKSRVVVLDFVTDLRRIAEVLELDAAVRGAGVERLGLGTRVIQFADQTAGDFLKEWMLDQASLVLRENDPLLDLPRFEYPEPPPPGGVQ